jgi:hypothetical protein
LWKIDARKRQVVETSFVRGKRDFLFMWLNGDQVLDFRVSCRKMSKAAKVSVLPHDFRRDANKESVNS